MLVFRTAVINDLPFIVDVYNSTVPGRMVTADTEPVTVEDKLVWFHEHDDAHPLWIVEEDEKQIGWVSLEAFYGRPAYNGTAEVSIYIHELHRGMKYGKRILDHVLDNPVKGIHTLLGFIFSHNEPSLKLFRNAGFKEWGLLKDIAVMDNNYYSLSILGRKI